MHRLYFISLVTLIGLFISSTHGHGQSLNFRGLVGFKVGGNVISENGTMAPRESINYQGVLAYEREDGWHYDVSYLFSPTFSRYKENLRAPWQCFGSMNVSHIMAGIGYTNVRERKGWKPFFSFRVGPSFFESTDGEFASFTKLTTALEGGMKIAFTENFGLVTSVTLLMPINWSQQELFVSQTREIEIIADPGITLVQFALNTGVYYRIPCKPLFPKKNGK
ncbi:MAG: hypothetical protein ACXIT9_08415 [Nitritalea sp.]